MLIGLGPAAAPLLSIGLIGVGIGSCWAVVAQHVMSGSKGWRRKTAVASVATVQQAGIGFGAAVAGLVANASGSRTVSLPPRFGALRSGCRWRMWRGRLPPV